MADGYQHAGEHDFDDLDEWLCEYVDGTIDPTVCEALEEYMQINPALAHHVERLREARHLLCQYGCSYRAPRGLQPRLRRRLASEIVEEAQPVLGSNTVHLMAIATLSSIVAVFLIFASATDTSSDTSIPVAHQETTSATPFFEPLPTLPSHVTLRVTPAERLSSSTYFSRFASPSSSAGYYTYPNLILLNNYMQFEPMESRLLPAVAAVPAP